MYPCPFTLLCFPQSVCPLSGHQLLPLSPMGAGQAAPSYLNSACNRVGAQENAL